MVEEEEQKQKIFSTIYISHSNETPKKKYFRIEKEKRYSSKRLIQRQFLPQRKTTISSDVKRFEKSKFPK